MAQRLKFGKAEILEHQKFMRKAPGTLLIWKDKKGNIASGSLWKWNVEN